MLQIKRPQINGHLAQYIKHNKIKKNICQDIREQQALYTPNTRADMKQVTQNDERLMLADSMIPVFSLFAACFFINFCFLKGISAVFLPESDVQYELSKW